MKLWSWLLFIFSFLIVFTWGCSYAAEISFEWSPYKSGECPGCTYFELWRNGDIINPSIPITQTEITISLVQDQEEDDYKLTAKNPQQRSGFSNVVRISDENFPVITRITQIK